MFFLIACIKEDDVLTFLTLGPILDHVFGPKKDKLFCPVNPICDLVLYLKSEGLNTSWIYPGTIPFQYLKTVFAIQYSSSIQKNFAESIVGLNKNLLNR